MAFKLRPNNLSVVFRRTIMALRSSFPVPAPRTYSHVNFGLLGNNLCVYENGVFYAPAYVWALQSVFEIKTHKDLISIVCPRMCTEWDRLSQSRTEIYIARRDTVRLQPKSVLIVFKRHVKTRVDTSLERTRKTRCIMLFQKFCPFFMSVL